MNDKPVARTSFIWPVVVPDTRPASQAVRVERLCDSVTQWHVHFSDSSCLRAFVVPSLRSSGQCRSPLDESRDTALVTSRLNLANDPIHGRTRYHSQVPDRPMHTGTRDVQPLNRASSLSDRVRLLENTSDSDSPPHGAFVPRLAVILGALERQWDPLRSTILTGPADHRPPASIDAGARSGQPRHVNSRESRWGRRSTVRCPTGLAANPRVLFGLTVFMASSIGCALAGHVRTLIAFRLLQALGGCAPLVVPRAVVRDFFRRARIGPDAVDADARHGPRADPGAAHRRPVAGQFRLAIGVLGSGGVRHALADSGWTVSPREPASSNDVSDNRLPPS